MKTLRWKVMRKKQTNLMCANGYFCNKLCQNSWKMEILVQANELHLAWSRVNSNLISVISIYLFWSWNMCWLLVSRYLWNQWPVITSGNDTVTSTWLWRGLSRWFSPLTLALFTSRRSSLSSSWLLDISWQGRRKVWKSGSANIDTRSLEGTGFASLSGKICGCTCTLCTPSSVALGWETGAEVVLAIGTILLLLLLQQ